MANAARKYQSAWLTKVNSVPLNKKVAISKPRVAMALRKAFGNHARAAAMLGLSRSRVTQIISADPELGVICEEAKEITADLGEDVVLHAMKQGDSSVARWFLEKSTVGKKRGYGGSTELSFGDDELRLLARSLGGDLEEARRFDAALDITPAQKQVAAQADDSSRDTGG